MTSSLLPPDLPVPVDRGEADHLIGRLFPDVILASSDGSSISLSTESKTKDILVFVYPRTAESGEDVPQDWNDIPGARGCTPHLCSVRDSIEKIHKFNSKLSIYGLSTQTTTYQVEVHNRLHLPYSLLSDASFKLQQALELPPFTWRGNTYLKRLTLFIRNGHITWTQFPVFPPDRAATLAYDKMVSEDKT